MANQFSETALDAIDVRHLQYFAVVAEENSLRRAAERLFMAQPPLSRQIKQLEERLGVALFARHSKGLTLTAEGAMVLEVVRPLLELKAATFARLREDIRSGGRPLRIGFTTAFEQGVFAKLEARLRMEYGTRAHIVRAASPRLAKDVRKGKLDTAVVALPLDAPGLLVRELAYREPLVAALPQVWGAAAPNGEKPLLLAAVTGRNLFWFKREANPAFFDFMKGRFARAGFEPHCIEEPAEYDVLLARIAAGEGMGLVAASFAAIRRDGVVFARLAETGGMFLQMGMVSLSDTSDLAAAVASHLGSSLSAECAEKPL